MDEFILWRQVLDKIGLGYERKVGSQYSFVDLIIFIIWKIFHCPSCFSAWLLGLSMLIILGTPVGFILMPLSYFLTSFIKNKVMTTSL